MFVADPKARTVAIREVRAGRSSNGMVEITEGLQPGEQVVTSGSLLIDRTLQAD